MNTLLFQTWSPKLKIERSKSRSLVLLKEKYLYSGIIQKWRFAFQVDRFDWGESEQNQNRLRLLTFGFG